jgi:hypothetical protein
MSTRQKRILLGVFVICSLCVILFATSGNKETSAKRAISKERAIEIAKEAAGDSPPPRTARIIDTIPRAFVAEVLKGRSAWWVHLSPVSSTGRLDLVLDGVDDIWIDRETGDVLYRLSCC